ncbi:hypothetical protein PT276_02680 [Orbaceae bacterium ESL0721]|nr:hypothetical protein [Orbaceae bacterium ESL0721]
MANCHHTLYPKHGQSPQIFHAENFTKAPLNTLHVTIGGSYA